MTRRRIDNRLFENLQASVNNALPLEYAIRASELQSPEGMQKLRVIDQQIRSFWLDLGAGIEQISHEVLVDYAWDYLQIGIPMGRRHKHVFHPDMLALIRKGFDKIPQVVTLNCMELGIPAVQFFRICDLLNGNDIQKLMADIPGYLEIAAKFGAKDRIKFDELPDIHIREPIRLHPGMKYVQSAEESGGRNFGILFDLDTDFSMEEITQQIQEFLYQYAIYRESVYPRATKIITRDLISSFLQQDLEGKHADNEVGRIDGFSRVLSGLYCWDKHKREGLKLDDAVEEVRNIDPRSEEAIKDNYRGTCKEIRRIKARFSRIYKPVE